MLEYRHVYNCLLDVLHEEIKKRARQTPEERAASECMAMYFAVNKYRKYLGKPAVSLSALKFDNSQLQADDDQAGFVSYCAQLIMEGD